MHLYAVIRSGLLPIRNKTNNNKHVICQLHSMQLQKEEKSNPKQPSCKKACGPAPNSHELSLLKFLYLELSCLICPLPQMER